jgi:putative photosynthetic complex assembly protein
MIRSAGTMVASGPRGWRDGSPLLRVMPTWLIVAVLLLPPLGFWLGLALRGDFPGGHARPAPVVQAKPDAPAVAPTPVRSVGMRRLRFVDAADKSVLVIDADTGAEVYRVVGEAGFVRGILRGMARERRRLGKGPEAPFELSLDAGLLTLRDLATGGHIELTAFGHTNAGAFARMLVEVASPAASDGEAAR